MVMAHPDDEVIFGWPILQDPLLEKRVLFCSTDENNPDRRWCSHRVGVARSFLSSMGIEMESMPYSSKFYRLDARSGKLGRFCKQLIGSINEHDFDVVFSHNPVGEYGHLDHVLTHVIVRSMGLPVWTTDIVVQSDWLSFPSLSQARHWCSGCETVGERENDLECYEAARRVYDKSGVWTWNMEPVQRCRILRIA